jgi:hypothetical protein
MIHDLDGLKYDLYKKAQRIAHRQCMKELLHGPPKSIYDSDSDDE